MTQNQFDYIQQITDNEGVSMEQCFRLNVYASMAVDNVIEIGSHLGKSTMSIGLALDKERKVFAIDPWQTTVWAEWDADKSRFCENIKSMGLQNVIIPVQNTSQEALQKQQVDKIYDPIGMLFIDGEHSYEAVKQDLKWIEHIQPGGYVILHDYGKRSKYKGVKKAMDEFRKNNPDALRWVEQVKHLAIFLKTNEN